MKFQKQDSYKAEKIKDDIAAFVSIMPENVKIDNVNYKVTEKDVVLNGMRSVMGQIDYGRSEIEIAKEISLENKKLVIMHEITHGITVERDVKDLIQEEYYDKIVDEISKGFIQVIRDNPALVQFIK